MRWALSASLCSGFAFRSGRLRPMHRTARSKSPACSCAPSPRCITLAPQKVKNRSGDFGFSARKQTFGVFAGLCWCIFRSSTEVKQRPCLKGELPTPKTKPATNPPADLIPHTQVAMGKPQLVVDLNSFLRKCNSSRIPGFSRCLTLAGGIL